MTVFFVSEGRFFHFTVPVIHFILLAFLILVIWWVYSGISLYFYFWIFLMKTCLGKKMFLRFHFCLWLSAKTKARVFYHFSKILTVTSSHTASLFFHSAILMWDFFTIHHMYLKLFLHFPFFVTMLQSKNDLLATNSLLLNSSISSKFQ